ncbi:MAG TPA: helix-turn-helix transcriptional regulator [Armatimonadota bacterium]|jgi:transcriptional regulator with XRE-family HTH domain
MNRPQKDPEAVAYGRRLKRLRVIARLTRPQLAKISLASEDSIKHYESGLRMPSSEYRANLERVLAERVGPCAHCPLREGTA